MEKRSIKQNGGKRLGAGRKKARHTLATEKAREFLIMEITKHLAPIVASQIDSALGVSYVGEKGRIYTKLPNARVAEYLLNQIAGKPNMSVELVSEENAPLIIRLDE
ncbi:MAG: hypothetical protein ABIG99_01225 [Patescibacteria group bacterium]